MIERMSSGARGFARRCVALAMAASLALQSFAASAQSPNPVRRSAIDNLPALGEASVDELSPAAEQRLGDQIYQELLRVGAVHDDPEAIDFLTSQARRLLQASNVLGHSDAARPFVFFLVKDPTINAFALPGGYIGIHTGLLTASDRESEVMSVLAHEIGHVTQRHIARMFGQQRQSSAVMIAAAVLAAMAARSSPDAAMGVLSLGQTVAIRDQLSFSRDAEREADRVGLQILSESGFDPAAMSSMFERLSQAGRLYDNNAPAYLRTHPLTTERIADIQSRLQSEPGMRRAAKGPGPNAPAYDWMRAKLMAMADTKVDGLRSARQTFEVQLKDPKFSSAHGPIHFGLAWVALSQRDFPSAIDHHRAALTHARSAGLGAEVAAMLAHLRLRIAMAMDSRSDMEQLATESIKAFAQSRAVMRTAVEARLAAGASQDETASLARGITQRWPNDPQAWALLGRAEAARGRRTAQHAAVAEQYAISGAYAAAVEQLTLARTAADADFLTLSKVDARLTAMRAALRREQIERQQQVR